MNQQPMLFAAVTDWCDRNEWAYEVLEEGVTIRSGFSGDNGSFLLYATVNDDCLMIRSIAPVKVPATKRAAMAELLTRINYSLLVGNFEMDFNDGEVACRTSIVAENQAVSSGIIQNLFFINCLMMDRHFPGIMQVSAGIEPEVALAALER